MRRRSLYRLRAAVPHLDSGAADSAEQSQKIHCLATGALRRPTEHFGAFNMNRDLLFTSYFAWGRAIDTEQFTGMTSRSNRYSVWPSYWDWDAMLWSFRRCHDP